MEYEPSNLAHRKLCLHELKILYRQLLLLNHQNQMLHKRKQPVNDQLLAKNKKLQIVIREKMKSVDKFIHSMNSIIGKKNETKKNEKVISSDKKNVMESLYFKVNADTTHWLRRPTVTPSTSSHSAAPRSSKINPVVKESKDAQTNTANEVVEQFKFRETALHNVIHYDSEIHWCQVCNVFPKTAKDYLNHLHTSKHNSIVSAHNLIELPWQKNEPDTVEPELTEAPIKRIPIRGLQFLVGANAWYCKLCSEWIGDLRCASNHLKSCIHSQKYSEFIEQHPHWEVDWLIERTKAYEQLFGNRYDSDKSKITQKILCRYPSAVSLINLNNLKEEKEDYIQSQASTSSSSFECECSTCNKQTSKAPREMYDQQESRISRLIRQETHQRGSEIYYTRKNKDNQNGKEVNYSKRSETYYRRCERGNKIQRTMHPRNERYDHLRSEKSYEVKRVMNARRRNELYETRIQINDRIRHEKSPPSEKSPKRKTMNRKIRQRDREGEEEKRDKRRRVISSGVQNPELCKTRNEVTNQLTRRVFVKTTTNKQNTSNDLGRFMKEKVKPVNNIKEESFYNVQYKSDGECSSTMTEEETEVEQSSVLPIGKTKTCYPNSYKTDSQADANSSNNNRIVVELQKMLPNNSQVNPLSSMPLNRIESVRSDPGSAKIIDIMYRQRADKLKNISTKSHNLGPNLPF